MRTQFFVLIWLLAGVAGSIGALLAYASADTAAGQRLVILALLCFLFAKLEVLTDFNQLKDLIYRGRRDPAQNKKKEDKR